MRILIFSDLHLHEWTYAATVTKEGLNSRLALQRDAIKIMLGHRSLLNADYIVFCGDFFHKHGVVTTPVLSVASELMETLAKTFDKKEVTFLVGNHDMGDNSGKIHAIDLFKRYGRIVAPRAYKSIKFPYPMNFIGYTDKREELVESLRKVNPGLLFMHQGISGVPVDSGIVLKNEILSPDIIPDHIEMAFAGHYHSPKKITEKLHVVGAPMQHTWGDKGARGWVVYDTDTSAVERYISGDPEFISVEYKEALNIIVGGDFIKVTDAEGDPEEVRQELLNRGAVSVEVIRKLDSPVQPAVVGQQPKVILDVINDFKKRVNKPGRFEEVGDEIMKGTYAPPTIPSI